MLSEMTLRGVEGKTPLRAMPLTTPPQPCICSPALLHPYNTPLGIRRVFMREPKLDGIDPVTGAATRYHEWLLDTEVCII